MSNFSQVYDLLLDNQQLHARVAGFYNTLSTEATSERVKMFLNALVKHESELSASLLTYTDKAPAKILHTFFNLVTSTVRKICLSLNFRPAKSVVMT